MTSDNQNKAARTAKHILLEAIRLFKPTRDEIEQSISRYAEMTGLGVHHPVSVWEEALTEILESRLAVEIDDDLLSELATDLKEVHGPLYGLPERGRIELVPGRTEFISSDRMPYYDRQFQHVQYFVTNRVLADELVSAASGACFPPVPVAALRLCENAKPVGGYRVDLPYSRDSVERALDTILQSRLREWINESWSCLRDAGFEEEESLDTLVYAMVTGAAGCRLGRRFLYTQLPARGGQVVEVIKRLLNRGLVIKVGARERRDRMRLLFEAGFPASDNDSVPFSASQCGRVPEPLQRSFECLSCPPITRRVVSEQYVIYYRSADAAKESLSRFSNANVTCSEIEELGRWGLHWHTIYPKGLRFWAHAFANALCEADLDPHTWVERLCAEDLPPSK